MVLGYLVTLFPFSCPVISVFTVSCGSQSYLHVFLPSLCLLGCLVSRYYILISRLHLSLSVPVIISLFFTQLCLESVRCPHLFMSGMYLSLSVCVTSHFTLLVSYACDVQFCFPCLVQLCSLVCPLFSKLLLCIYCLCLPLVFFVSLLMVRKPLSISLFLMYSFLCTFCSLVFSATNNSCCCFVCHKCLHMTLWVLQLDITCLFFSQVSTLCS